MGTIKGKRQFNRLNNDLDELYSRINQESYQYKHLATTWFIERVEMLLKSEIFKNMLTLERVETILNMVKDLTCNIYLDDEVVVDLEKLIKRLNNLGKLKKGEEIYL